MATSHPTTVPFLGLLALLSACAINGAGSELGGAEDDDDDDLGISGGTGGSDELGGLGGGPSGGGAPPEGFAWPTTIECPAVDQHVLMFDFRSGWWDDFYHLFASPPAGHEGHPPPPVLETLGSTCGNIHIEYHHLFNNFELLRCAANSSGVVCLESFYFAGGGLAPVLQRPFDDYTQLWVLSGSDSDGGTTQSGQLFVDFLQATQGSCVPVLIGGGAGNHAHGNTVSAALGLGNVFTTTNPTEAFIPWGVTIETTAQGFNHALFAGLGEVADEVSAPHATDPNNPYDLSTLTLPSDGLVPNPAAYESVATAANGQSVMAVGSIDLPGDGVRPFVLDGGLQRYYTVGTHEPTRRLLGNLVQLLGLVGCKSEVPK